MKLTTDHKIEISKRLKEEFDNGREYYSLHGGAIALPEAEELRPATDMLEWHNRRIFHA